MSYDRCVRCGSCMKICPIFDAMSEEQYSPRGKLYLLQIMDELELDPEAAKEFRKLLFTCTMCGRCKEICSSDVDLLKIYHEQRGKSVHEHPEEFAYLGPLQKSLENVQNIYGLDPEDRAMFWLDELEDEIPGLADRVYDEGKTAEVMIFLGCLMSFRSSQLDVLRSLLTVLEKSKVDYMVMGAEEFCCGHPLYLMGDDDGASELRKHNKSVFEKAGAKQVVTCCPGCLIQLKEHHELENIDALHHTEFFDKQYETLPAIKHDKQFRMMPYPNRSHGIYEGENTTRHLYELLTRYLKENLTPGPASE